LPRAVLARGFFTALSRTLAQEGTRDYSPVLFLCRQGGNGMYYDQKESGKRIATLRKQNRLTQEQLAEKLNISTSNLGKLERGLQGLSIDLLIEIGIFFGVSTDYILLGCEIQPNAAKAELDSVIAQLTALKQKL
jgi:DNA-binding XRE family transcriptional regulator